MSTRDDIAVVARGNLSGRGEVYFYPLGGFC